MTEILDRKIDVAGLKVDAITKDELLTEVADRIAHKEKTIVVTPYSEFLYASLKYSHIREMLNKADYAVPDGIGVLWAQLFLSRPLNSQNFNWNVFQAWCQVVWTGASILLNPKKLYEVFPEKIVGADLAWDLAGMAEQNNFSLYLLGARGNVAEKVAEKFRRQYPEINIAGISNKDMDDPSIFSDITKAAPDMIFVAFNRLSSEKWMMENLKDLPASFAIALGGTFDYIAGVKIAPPKFIRQVGLEWLYRLVTQPQRIKRIFEATWGLVLALVRLKVFSIMPYRQNACAVVTNQEGKILLCKRINNKNTNNHFAQKFENYWQFPQGGLDKNEDPILGAQRELWEETGIKSVEVIAKAKYNHRYQWNNAGSPLLNRRFRFRGQSQHTVFLKFLGDESEIQLDNHELTAYQWVTIDQVEKIIAPERREHAQVVLAELKELQV